MVTFILVLATAPLLTEATSKRTATGGDWAKVRAATTMISPVQDIRDMYYIPPVLNRF
jgi:hypothetical protein